MVPVDTNGGPNSLKLCLRKKISSNLRQGHDSLLTKSTTRVIQPNDGGSFDGTTTPANFLA